MYSSSPCKYRNIFWPVSAWAFICPLYAEVDVTFFYWQLFEINVSAATQRKKDDLHKHHVQLEKEKEMLKHNKLEWVWQ